MTFFSVLKKLYLNLTLKILEKIFEKPWEACRLGKFHMMKNSRNNFLKNLDEIFFSFGKLYSNLAV